MAAQLVARVLDERVPADDLLPAAGVDGSRSAAARGARARCACAGTTGSSGRRSGCSRGRSRASRRALARAAAHRSAAAAGAAHPGARGGVCDGRRHGAARAAQRARARQRRAAPLSARARAARRRPRCEPTRRDSRTRPGSSTRLRADHPRDWQAILEANNAAPPMWLRVNLLRTTRAAYLEKLEAAGLAARRRTGRRVGRAVSPSRSASSRCRGSRRARCRCRICRRSARRDCSSSTPGQRVLDACAAPGGKTGHILEAMPRARRGLGRRSRRARGSTRVRDNLDASRLDGEARHGRRDGAGGVVGRQAVRPDSHRRAVQRDRRDSPPSRHQGAAPAGGRRPRRRAPGAPARGAVAAAAPRAGGSSTRLARFCSGRTTSRSPLFAPQSRRSRPSRRCGVAATTARGGGAAMASIMLGYESRKCCERPVDLPRNHSPSRDGSGAPALRGPRRAACVIAATLAVGARSPSRSFTPPPPVVDRGAGRSRLLRGSLGHGRAARRRVLPERRRSTIGCRRKRATHCTRACRSEFGSTSRSSTRAAGGSTTRTPRCCSRTSSSTTRSASATSCSTSIAATKLRSARCSRALEFLGRVERLPLIDTAVLDDDRGYYVRLRAVLDEEQFPGPLRLLAFWRRDWSIASDWYRWPLRSE